MIPARSFVLLPLLTLVAIIVACSSGGSATPDEPPAADSPTQMPAAESPVATLTPTANTGASSDTPSRPGPPPGVACPVPVAVCEFAVQIETTLESGDADAFFAIAHPVTATCTGQQGLGGPSPALCEGASPGETRTGYWALQGGEGLIVTEAELRAALVRWLDAISRAGGTSDAYGTGDLKIGAISCTRQLEQKSGDCIGNSIQVHFTFINPETVDGTGLPGQRISFHVSASVVDSEIRANGLGTVVPPNSVLEPRLIKIQNGQGNPLLVENYPWTH